MTMDDRTRKDEASFLAPKALAIVLDFIDDGVLWIDRECRIVAMSRSLAILVGISRDTAVGSPCREVFGCQDAQGNLLCAGEYGCAALAGEAGVRPDAGTVVLFSGETPYYTESVARPLTGEHDEFAGMIRFFRVTAGRGEPAPGMAALLRHLHHELRTPLTTVRGYLDLLLSGDAGALNDLQREFLGEASRSAHHLAEFIAVFLEREISDWYDGRKNHDRETENQDGV